MADRAIDVEHLTKIYRLYRSPKDRLRESISISRKKYHREFYALKDISFTASMGKTIGVIGQNGSGKSTLLKIISGVTRPTSGRVGVNGRIASLLELGAGFHPEFSGRDNVYMNGALMGLSRQEMDKRFPEIEAFAEIGDFIDQPVKSYSSGMFVRLAFASAINIDPDILIVDEVLAVGDMLFRHRCMNKIREFRQKKLILFVSHDMETVVNFCDEVMWINSGEIAEIGDPKTLSEHYLTHMYELSNQSFQRPPLTTPVQERPTASPSPAKRSVYVPKLQERIVKRFGKGSARVMGAEIVDQNGTRLEVLTPGRLVNVAVLINSIENVASPIVGFRIRNVFGQEILATNTDIEGYRLPPLKAGARCGVNFTFVWPHIAPGSYQVSVAIADGNFVAHVMDDWVDDALIVQSQTVKKTIGLVGIDDMEIRSVVV